jgi:hypothetical protein
MSSDVVASLSRMVDALTSKLEAQDRLIEIIGPDIEALETRKQL